MGPYDDPEYGPGYWEPEGQDAVDEAFAEGAASRDAEVSTLLEEREEWRKEIAGLRAEVSAQQREIPAPLSVFAFSNLVGRGDIYVQTSSDRSQVEGARDFCLSDPVCYGVSPIVVLVREDAVAEATRAERDRIAWLAEGMANKLHTMDADMVAGCLADLVAYLRSDK